MYEINIFDCSDDTAVKIVSEKYAYHVDALVRYGELVAVVGTQMLHRASIELKSVGENRVLLHMENFEPTLS